VMQEGFGRDAVALPLDETAATSTAVPVQADTGETLSPLVAFLTHAALESGDNQAQAGQEAVQLMTVHAAKGLEFDAVFITGLEEGLFPHQNSLNDPASLEEERRLMYVAITRARRRLYLSHAQTRMLHGQTRDNMPSRFLDELPESSLKWITPKQAARSGGGGGWSARTGSWGRGGGSMSGGSSRYGAGGAAAHGSASVGKGLAAVAQGARTPAAAGAHGLRVGMGVFHAKFGEGQVLTLEGQGDDARAQIHFPRHGTKWLALSVAKLTPL
jgi:DNA helicase II / ATP-dependent DNA helicase PcrA